MKRSISRRQFGWALAAGAAGAEAGRAAEDGPPESGPIWFPTEEVSELRLKDEESPEVDVVLHAAVKRLEEPELKVVPPDNDDGIPTYFWKGRNLSELGFWAPGQSMITRFDLQWDAETIPIEERFWNDLPRMTLRRIVLPKGELDDEQRLAYLEQRRELRSPWLKVSAHGGTVLITWSRGEE